MPSDTLSRCQSCGTSFEKLEDHGTEANGQPSADYCRLCYQNGQFTMPCMTLEDMLLQAAGIVSDATLLPPKKARDVAITYIPYLKRWKKSR